MRPAPVAGLPATDGVVGAPTARLLPGYARAHPALDPGQWYQVVGQEPLGLWLAGAGGDPFVTAGRRFVFRAHFEVADG